MNRMMMLAVAGVAGSTASLSAQVVLLQEDFDSLVLNPPRDETGGPANPGDVWTNAAPSNWWVDKCLTPADGVRDWRGWNFADALWWVAAAGNQDRSLFVFPLATDGKSSGTAAIADPDEWDDLPHPPGEFDSTLYTPEIAVAGVSSATIEFDSSFRPYAAMTGTVEVSFDGGSRSQLLLLDASTAGGDSSLDRVNEHVTLPVAVPNGAQSMVVSFRMSMAGNDWWWAIDNVLVTGNTAPSNANGPSSGDCPAEPPFCDSPADFNSDGFINTNDFFAFLAAYQAGCP